MLMWKAPRTHEDRQRPSQHADDRGRHGVAPDQKHAGDREERGRDVV